MPYDDANDNPVVDDEEYGSASSMPRPTGWGARHTLAFLGFWGFVASYAMRVNLSVAIVAMAGTKGSGTDTNRSIVCPNLVDHEDAVYLRDTRTTVLDTPPEFDWDEKEQGIILGSFFWGYVVTQVPGGMLAERIGGKWPFGIGMLVTAVFSLLTPWAARTGIGALIVVRVIQGLGEGVTNPAMHAMLARWAPPLERSRFGGYVYAGAQIGTVIALPLSGWLTSTNFLGGWPSVFYVFGGLGIVWFVFWTIFVYDAPSRHPHIDMKELNYIEYSIGDAKARHKIPTPWRRMLTSMPVIAILVAQTGHGWGLYTLLTELPTYMQSVLHFDLKKNGLLSALPYLMMWIMSLIVTWIADTLREAKTVSTTTARKMFNTVAHWGPAFALVGASYSGCNVTSTLAFLTLAVGLNGAHFASFQVNHIDIAPNHAGVMMGITNGFANLCGIAAPYTAGVILKNGTDTIQSWRTIFLISSGIYFSVNVFYLIFASGKEQPWNKSDEEDSGFKDRDPLLQNESPGSSVSRRSSPSSRRNYDTN